MPSPLETIVKILKLEREQGCENTAVIGGLGAYSKNWQNQALDQAKRPEQVILVREISTLLDQYESVDNKTERMQQISYMLDRIMNRIPPPEEYQEMLETVTVEVKVTESSQKSSEKSAPPAEKPKDEARVPEAAVDAPDKPKTDDSQQSKSDQSSKQSSSRSKTEHVQELDYEPMPEITRPPRNRVKNRTPEEEETLLRALQKPVTEVKGIGAKLASTFESIDIQTINDLLYYFPRRYDDYTQLKNIIHLSPNSVATVIGTVKYAEVRIGKNGRKDFIVVLDDGIGQMTITFFGQYFLNRSIKVGQSIVVRGKVGIYRSQFQMNSPDWEHIDIENLQQIGIIPVYPLTEGLKSRSFRKLMKQVVDEYAPQTVDFVPISTLERCELGDLDWALQNIHFPQGRGHLDHARRRLGFNELLVFQLAVLRNRREWQSVPGYAFDVTDDFLESLTKSIFPYELTNAQNRAIADIRADVSQPIPMNRLIQGDVGSGKTAVAIVAMAMAIQNGKQAALMAPTSILAEQHYRNILETLRKSPSEQKPVVALLTAKLNTMERESVYRGLADGSIDVVIGTHALIQEGVEFRDLGLAVIDEQHRFGVDQRGALRGKGSNPHVLVMTATPIPRTLALTMYADLDLSIIDEKPPGRQPIETKVIEPVARERAIHFVDWQLEQGRQAFIIHPLVEASDKIEARSAVEAYEDLSKVFYQYRVCLLHGRMTPAEKDEVMEAFSNHEYDVMVTTSVAEVGVDVPNASVIVIEGANRFGLSQLHQFRGRVGRGEHKSYCILLPDSNSEESIMRLQAMQETDDGFRLAELDWEIRGAGDLLGTRQSGANHLQLAELIKPDLVELAQREARTIYAEDPDLTMEHHRLLAKRVFSESQESGDVS